MQNTSKYLGNELKYVQQVLDSEKWSSTEGSWTGLLEREFAKKMGSKHAVAFNSGTSTLHAALIAAGVNPGDEVISPALTVIMDTTSTLHANAIPVYADINEETFNVDPKDIERKITAKTKAIIVVSLYGLPPDMDEIMAISKRYGIPVIEDNAQCFLSKYKGSMSGTIGHIASYSFENSKHLSCGEGGIIITDDEEFAKIARKVGGHGFKNLMADEGRVKADLNVFQNPNYKRHDELGWNYRLSEFLSAIAFAQLERIDELVELRKKSAEIFLDVMSECSFLIPQKVPADRDNSYWSLAVKYEGEREIGVSWADFRKAYVQNGGDGIYGAWSVPYLEPLMQERTFVKRCPQIYQNISYAPGLCPIAEQVQQKLMQFKTNYRNLDLAKEKARILQQTINSFASKNKRFSNETNNNNWI